MVLGPTAVILKMAHQRPELETPEAVIAQLGERQTEDLEVLGSIPSPGTVFVILLFFFLFEFFERNFFGAPVART